MPFNIQTRNRLARFVNDARELIAFEFAEQLRGIYGLSTSGSIAPLADLKDLDEEHQAIAELLRERVQYLQQSSANSTVAAIERLAREQAFTVLNRMAALRMAEKRSFIVESVGRGYQSRGFQVYSQVVNSGLGDTYHRYRQYLFCLFDELALDLGTLFDRRSPTGLLFPRETALFALFQMLNAPDIDPLWAEDETIGWIYQYYNDEAERKQMRELGAPRNSRELAVRNQFFTPRYVVEFLADNTLGRIWYEMSRGKTQLKTHCRYLTCRPNESFLDPNQLPPEGHNEEDITQSQILNTPVYITHRAIKDPRELRFLDPACGSMHFGLYIFDLLEIIYEEAWDLAEHENLSCSPSLKPLHEVYPSKAALLRDIPKLIIENNIHGIDIDPRAVQIAGVSLWLRAQRSWQKLHLPLQERPRIARSHLVCAEPMPGNSALLKDFTKSLHPSVLGQLVTKIFTQMELAGEAGSLLKIEEEIAVLVREAKRQWQETPKPEQEVLFAEAEKPTQGEFRFDRTGITDEQFWDSTEQRIYEALHAYAEHVDVGYSHRLFAEDTARGFAFIDLCRKRYDVVLMNPPFGPSAEGAVAYLTSAFPNSKHDLALCAVDRAKSMLTTGGRVGAIITRTPLFLPTSFDWREDNLLGKSAVMEVMADFGLGVLDATVESAAFAIRQVAASSQTPWTALFVRAIETEEKAERLLNVITEFNEGHISKPGYFVKLRDLYDIPFAPISYWTPASIRRVFREFRPFQTADRDAKCGLGTLDDFRFLRLFWETNPEEHGSAQTTWVNYADGGSFIPFYESSTSLVNWKDKGKEVKQFVTQKVGSASRKVQGASFYFQPGLTFPRRTKRFCPRPLQKGSIFSTAGQGIFLPTKEAIVAALGLLSSDVCKYLISLSLGSNSQDQGGTNPQFEVGIVKRLPWPNDVQNPQLAQVTQACTREQMVFESAFERSRIFSQPLMLPGQCSSISERRDHLTELAKNHSASLRTSVDRLNEIARALYDLSHEDLRLLKTEIRADDDTTISPPDETYLCESLISWAVGCALGRWDLRFATGEKPVRELPDPFSPLPPCQPAQLQNENGLPITKDEVVRLKALDRWYYPLDLPWDGILVEDSGHPMDIEEHVHMVLQIMWPHQAEMIEQEAYRGLGVRVLREYFRKPSGFFAAHLKRYSTSRRQAPIYWPISTRSCSYTLWIYYPRLTVQTLHTCLADFVDPKIKSVSAELQSARTTKGDQTRLGELRELEDELNEMRTEIDRVIKLPYIPNLDDGAMITACPLWRLARLPKWHKDLKTCWGELERGDYDWAHLAHAIWPERVEQKCKHDRSIAIAHDLETLCVSEKPKTKSRRQREKQPSLNEGGAPP